jgi:hypothetical protein
MAGCGVRADFFYLSLCALPEGEVTGDSFGYRFDLGSVHDLILRYGLGRFLADIDEQRAYRTEGGIVGSLLSYCSGPGFGELFKSPEFNYTSAKEYRDRYLIQSLKGLFNGN